MDILSTHLVRTSVYILEINNQDRKEKIRYVRYKIYKRK